MGLKAYVDYISWKDTSVGHKSACLIYKAILKHASADTVEYLLAQPAHWFGFPGVEPDGEHETFINLAMDREREDLVRLFCSFFQHRVRRQVFAHPNPRWHAIWEEEKNWVP